MDLNWVNNRIAVGAAISQEDVPGIIGLGINVIIDVTDAGDDTPLFSNFPGAHILWNPTPDDGQPKSVEWFKTSLDFALPLFIISNNKLYFHCSAGINRGPSVCYCFLRSLGFSPEDAESMIRKVRPQVEIAYKNDADLAITALGY